MITRDDVLKAVYRECDELYCSFDNHECPYHQGKSADLIECMKCANNELRKYEFRIENMIIKDIYRLWYEATSPVDFDATLSDLIIDRGIDVDDLVEELKGGD